MRDIKTRSADRAPRVKDYAARAPKELVRRTAISMKEQAEETAAKAEQSDSPAQYAENKAESAAYDAAHDAVGIVRRGSKKAVRKVKEWGKQDRSSHSASKKRTARKTADTSSAQHIAKASKTVKNTRYTANAAKDTARAAQKTVKTAGKGIKTTAEATRKGTQVAAKAAKAAARAAQAAVRAAATAAKATAQAVKVAAKALAAVVKACIAAIKGLISAIAAGGWVVVLIIAVVVVAIIAVLAVFGVFSANDTEDGSRPMTEAVEEINNDFKAAVDKKITKLSEGADIVEVIYEGDMEGEDCAVPNWVDVIAVYSAKNGFDSESPVDVTAASEESIDELRTVFNDMNSVSYRTETETDKTILVDEYGAIVLDEDGNPVIITTVTVYIYVNVMSADYMQAAEQYDLGDDQKQMLIELMRPEYYPFFAELLGDSIGDGGEYGFGLDINPDLPANELGAKIVFAAKKYIGRSYAYMDCSKLCRTAYNDCGLTSMNGLSSVLMAEKCEEMGVLFTDPSRLQAGDLIFFSRFDPERGPEYCGDIGRCGTGKCRRWMHIHHVAIYINDEFLIDSTGGDNSVQIRKHWGMDTAKWKWVCFGRPVT